MSLGEGAGGERGEPEILVGTDGPRHSPGSVGYVRFGSFSGSYNAASQAISHVGAN